MYTTNLADFACMVFKVSMLPIDLGPQTAYSITAYSVGLTKL